MVTITDAAIMYKGKLYAGKRHADIMKQIWDEEQSTNTKFLQNTQGFLTSDGQFVNRFQAGTIAYMAGQTKKRYDKLLSEHVW